MVETSIAVVRNWKDKISAPIFYIEIGVTMGNMPKVVT